MLLLAADLEGQKPGSAGIKPSQLNDDVWPRICLANVWPVAVDAPVEDLFTTIRAAEETLFFYLTSASQSSKLLPCLETSESMSSFVVFRCGTTCS
jgi:hypothetical protein